MKLHLTFLVAFLLLSGCAGRIEVVMESWVGAHESELVERWGPPDSVVSDGKGGTILTYEGAGKVGESRGQVKVNAVGRVTVTSPKQHTYKRYRMFYVDKDGIIYSWKWKGL